MLIIDWDSEQYFTSWEDWFKSFDYEKMTKEIMEEEEFDDEGEATNFLISQAIEAKTITVLHTDFYNFENSHFELTFTEMKY